VSSRILLRHPPILSALAGDHTSHSPTAFAVRGHCSPMPTPKRHMSPSASTIKIAIPSVCHGTKLLCSLSSGETNNLLQSLEDIGVTTWHCILLDLLLNSLFPAASHSIHCHWKGLSCQDHPYEYRYHSSLGLALDLPVWRSRRADCY
jgi:hypothetical protein